MPNAIGFGLCQLVARFFPDCQWAAAMVYAAEEFPAARLRDWADPGLRQPGSNYLRRSGAALPEVGVGLADGVRGRHRAACP